jgi:hypothetical protein
VISWPPPSLFPNQTWRPYNQLQDNKLRPNLFEDFETHSRFTAKNIKAGALETPALLL